MGDYFYELTPEPVFTAIEKGGFKPTGHIMALNSYENRVYDLKLEDGSHIVSKFYRPGRWSEEQIREEHSFLLELNEAEIPVCAPMTFPDGDTLHSINGIFYAIWPRTGGRSAHDLSDTDIQVIGRLLARIHNVGAVKPIQARHELTSTEYALNSLAYLLQNDFLPSQCRDRFEKSVREVAQLYQSYSEGVPFHRIHADCHPGNLLKGSDGWFIFDFDDFCSGPAVQDIWMLYPGNDREGERHRELLLEAYQTFRPFNRSWLKLIEPLRALRFIRYAGWIAKRWKDPVFPMAFPHFGTDDYWMQETDELVQQLHLIKSGEPHYTPEPDPIEELTDSDYFYDM
ncbi:MAG: serine/threonine protein kinase [Spirochaetes bacterium]|jgi:Ser/Thr protein kinase RdoA (MazF antagonist)|nr:serine/threonine protein kinase [Spirochaetota bacterium]